MDHITVISTDITIPYRAPKHVLRRASWVPVQRSQCHRPRGARCAGTLRRARCWPLFANRWSCFFTHGIKNHHEKPMGHSDLWWLKPWTIVILVTKSMNNADVWWLMVKPIKNSDQWWLKVISGGLWWRRMVMDGDNDNSNAVDV